MAALAAAALDADDAPLRQTAEWIAARHPEAAAYAPGAIV